MIAQESRNAGKSLKRMLGKMIYAVSSAMRDEGKVTAVEGLLASEGVKVSEPLKRELGESRT